MITNTFMVATKTITKPFAYDLSNMTLDYEYTPSSDGISRSFGLAVSPDGLTAITLNRDTHSLVQWSFGTAWNLNTLSHVKNQLINDNRPVGLFIDATGQNVYTSNGSNRTIYQHTLLTPWDISSYSSVGSTGAYSVYRGDMWFKPDGTEMYGIDYTSGTTVTQQTLFTPWDITSISNTKTETIGARGIFLSNDGKTVISQKWNSNVTAWELSIPWDISSNKVEVSSTGYVGISCIGHLNEDIGKLYVTTSGYDIRQYDLNP